MFKTGSIRKVEVTDFVTYSHVEFYPGPNLNMLIGPNGTGKSTIVAAIILGLGGNPKVVGRGHKVSEYIKHNCEKATIHIHLQGHDEQTTLKITREITTKTSSWFLNNQRVTENGVLNHIKEYNIQVDNLCQFLPQDRVQDFAKLNQQQLLKETQLALCRNDLIEKQQTLIECRENHKKLEETINKTNVNLQENRDANLRLAGKIDNFSKKKEFLHKVEDIDRKIAWMQYDEVYGKMVETKEDLKTATQIYEKHKSAARPIEREIEEVKSLVGGLQQAKSNITRALRENNTSAKNYVDKIEQTKDGICDIENDMNEKIAVIEEKKREIEETAAKVEEHKLAQRELLNKCGNDDEIQQKVQKIKNDIQKFRRAASELQNQKDELMSARQTKSAQLRAMENEKNRLENVKEQRLSFLRKLDQDAHEGVLWLRNNRHLFQDHIFEPIMLELNVLNSKNAIYVENVIPIRDRVAFTCMNKEDMNALIRYLREEKQLTVNVIYAGDSNATQFHPRIPIEQLRRYGLHTYLHSLFTAPEPIMKYLCRTYGIHNIPVGGSSTNNHFHEIPAEINVFFSDTIRYSVSYSKYTNAKSTRQNELAPARGGLSISVDVLELERLQGQIQELRNSMTNCDDRVKEFDLQIAAINDKVQTVNGELKYIHTVKQQVQITQTRIVAMERRIQEMRSSSFNVENIQAEAKEKIKRKLATLGQLIGNLISDYENQTKLTVKSALNSIKIDNARRKVAYLENKNQEAKRALRESEATMNQVKEAYADTKGKARAALQKAKGLSKDFTPDDDSFAEFREIHENLPANFDQLQDERQRLEAMIDCLNTADDEEMREYEERIQAIENLQGTIDKAHVDLSKNTARIDQLQEEWLGPLRSLVGEISGNFSTAFEKMGCAGEISVNPGANEQEFSMYGLSVKVAFRNGEPLQELNNVTQSGGERAVTTAIFMFALQELTPVPFRCVDEINQGMDANNERRIFDLLLESTSHTSSPQYFLITPKLVPKLMYSDTTMVHVVHNGPFVAQDRKWGMSKMCNPQGVRLH